MCCRDLTTWQGTRLVALSMTARWHDQFNNVCFPTYAKWTPHGLPRRQHIQCPCWVQGVTCVLSLPSYAVHHMLLYFYFHHHLLRSSLHCNFMYSPLFKFISECLCNFCYFIAYSFKYFSFIGVEFIIQWHVLFSTLVAHKVHSVTLWYVVLSTSVLYKYILLVYSILL